LERRVARGGHPTIDHAPGQHDDLANAVAGGAVLALSKGRYNLAAMSDDVDADPTSIDDYRRQRLHPNLSDEQYRRIMRPGRLAVPGGPS
jgi:hypothetical protein